MHDRDWLKFIHKNLGTIALYTSLVLCIGIASFCLIRYLKITHNFLPPIMITSSAILAGFVIYIFIKKVKEKENNIESLFQRILNRSSASESEIVNSSGDEYLTPDCDEQPNVAPQPIEAPSDLPQSSFLNDIEVFDKVHFFSLLKIFNAILKAFPSTKHLFSNENKILYVMNLRTLPIQEQFALFKHLLERNSEDEILEQLVTLMQDLEANEMDAILTSVLQKLEDIVDLAYSIEKRELIVDVLLLMILITNAERLNL